MASNQRPTGSAWNAWLKSAERAKRQGRTFRNFVDKNGNEWYLDRKQESGKPARFSPKSLSAKQAEANVRRAAAQRSTIQQQEYIDFAKRNLYPDPIKLGTVTFQAMTGGLNHLAKKVSGTQYGHLSPITSVLRGGLEHVRSIIRQPTADNAEQSDRVPTKDAHRAAGMPMTRSGAIRADIRGEPILLPEHRNKIVMDDIRTNNPPRARDVNKSLAAKATGYTKINGVLTSGLGTIGYVSSDPLSPLNPDSGLYGAIERKTNEEMPSMTGVSAAVTLRLAD